MNNKNGAKVGSFVEKGVLPAVMFLAVICSVYMAVRINVLRDVYTAISAAVLLMALHFTLLLYFFCVMGGNSAPGQKKLFLLLICTEFSVALCSFFVSCFEGIAEKKDVCFILYSALYILSDVYWVIFWFYQKDAILRERNTKKMQAVYLFFSVLYLSVIAVNVFTPVFFYIDGKGNFVSCGLLGQMCSFLLFVLYGIFIFSSKNTVKRKLTLISYFLFPFITGVAIVLFPENEFLWNTSEALLDVAYLIPLYLLFFNMYLENGRLLTEKEKALAESRANALTLQINPHFIANTLSSVAALCSVDPSEAEKLTVRFAKYLRIYYSERGGENFIPFEKELEQIENYLAIEQTRFTRLKVEKNIGVSDFMLPTLAVQPLVENAVLHGLLPRHGEGTIKIETEENDTAYVIRIIDDGVGFDKLPEDGKTHIGISNSRSRLEMLCGGRLTVTGTPGVGAISEVVIPKKEDKA